MVSVTSLVAGLSPGVAFAAQPYLAGARVFHAESAGERLWVAELTRFTGGASTLGNNLFVSADGRNFHQLKVVERAGGAVLTDTPGFASALATYVERGLCLILADKERPEGGVRYLLDRVNNRILEGASFFSVPEGVRPVSSGTRVSAAEKDREPDRLIRAHQENLAAFDRGRGRPKEYRLDRGLEECSSWSSATSFGRIDDKIEARLGGLSVYRSSGLKILTVGPGLGVLERELKDRFADGIAIDTFSLTDTIAPENWSAFREVFVGNLDTHRLPEGYDLVISVFGTSYAVDQRRTIGRVIDALNPGGEAYFLVAGEMLPGHEPEGLGSDDVVFLRNRCGVSYQAFPHPENTLKTGLIFESIVVSKTRSLPPAETLLAPKEDMAEIARGAWDAVRLVAQSRGLIVDPKATELDLDRFRERLAWKRRRYRKEHSTTIQTALFFWPWVERQGIFVKH